jgi:hypothetical protein
MHLFERTSILFDICIGLAFSRANKANLIRCDLSNFDETTAVVRQVLVEESRVI